MFVPALYIILLVSFYFNGCAKKVSHFWSTKIHVLISKSETLIPFKVASSSMHTFLPEFPGLLETFLGRSFWNDAQPCRCIPHAVFSWLKSCLPLRHFQSGNSQKPHRTILGEQGAWWTTEMLYLVTNKIRRMGGCVIISKFSLPTELVVCTPQHHEDDERTPGSEMVWPYGAYAWCTTLQSSKKKQPTRHLIGWGSAFFCFIYKLMFHCL